MTRNLPRFYPVLPITDLKRMEGWVSLAAGGERSAGVTLAGNGTRFARMLVQQLTQ